MFLLEVSRPLGWIIAPLVFLIGLYYSKAELGLLPIIQIVLLSFPYSLLLFGINDIYDIESDKINPRKRSIEFHGGDARLIKIVSAAASSLLLMSSLFTYNLSNILCVVLILLLSYFYSIPPVRLKERPPIDSFSNGALFFLVFSMGWSFGNSVVDIPLKIYFVAFCVMGIHAFGTVMDYSFDRRAGHKTFAVVLGRRTASLFALFTFVSAYLFSGIGSNVINYYFIFAIALLLVSIVFTSQKTAVLLFKLIFAGFIITAVSFVAGYITGRG